MVAPPRRKAVELRMILGSIPIRIPLKVTKTYMHDHVDPLQFSQAFKEIERQCPKIVRVQQGQM